MRFWRNRCHDAIHRPRRRAPWRTYKAYCLNWRRHGNRPEFGIFVGNDESRVLFEVFRAARRALQAVSGRVRYRRNNPRFQLQGSK